MRSLIIIILFFKTSLTFGQKVEQKALTFLVNQINGLKFKYSNGSFIMSKDSSRIWYYPYLMNIAEDKISGERRYVQDSKSKLHINKGIRSNEDKFYKVVHSEKDIFIITIKALATNQNQSVNFVIMTKYAVENWYTVMFKDNVPFTLLSIVPPNFNKNQN